jgi:hypothetical protein
MFSVVNKSCLFFGLVFKIRHSKTLARSRFRCRRVFIRQKATEKAAIFANACHNKSKLDYFFPAKHTRYATNKPPAAIHTNDVDGVLHRATDVLSHFCRIARAVLSRLYNEARDEPTFCAAVGVTVA